MWNVMVKEWKEFFSRKTIRILFCFVPIILIIGVFCQKSADRSKVETPQIHLGIIDKDQSMYSKFLVQYFNQNERFGGYAAIITGDEQKILSAYDRGELNAYLILPLDFAENLIEMVHTPIEVKINSEDMLTAIIIKNVLEGYEKYITSVEMNVSTFYEGMEISGVGEEERVNRNRELSIDLIRTVLGRNTIFLHKEIKDMKTTPITTYYFYGIVGVLLLYSGLYTGFHYLKEKECHIIGRVVTTGLSKVKYISGMILGDFIIVGGSSLFLYLGLQLGQKKEVSWITIIVILAMVLFSILFGIGLALIWKEKRSFMVAGNMIYMMICLLGGAVIPVMYLPETVVEIAKCTPVYWFIRFMTN